MRVPAVLRRAAPALLCAAALFGHALLVPGSARAAWPEQPIRMIVPYAAGGSTDVSARLLAEALSTRLPQRVIVENRTGAASAVGAEAVARAAPDGHTVLFSNVGHSVLRVLNPRLGFDPARDLVPVTVVTEGPMVLLVSNDFPARTLAEFVREVRAHPGRYDYGTAGGGGSLQLAAFLLQNAAGLRMNEVPYRGGAPATLDLAAGRIAMLFDVGISGFQTAKGGQARALAVSGARRSPTMPDVPTLREGGVDAEMALWQAVFVPAGVPREVQLRFQEAIAAALRDEAVAARIRDLGTDRIVLNTPDAARAYVDAETARWEALLRAAGVGGAN